MVRPANQERTAIAKRAYYSPGAKRKRGACGDAQGQPGGSGSQAAVLRGLHGGLLQEGTGGPGKQPQGRLV